MREGAATSQTLRQSKSQHAQRRRQVWGGLSVGCGKGDSETGKPDGESGLWRQAHMLGHSPTSNGDAVTEVSRHSGTVMGPLFQMGHHRFRTVSFCPVEAGLGDMWNFPFEEWKLNSILGSTDGLKGNAQSISIPYSFLHSKMYFPCVLVSTPFSCMSWDKWLKPSCCGFLIYKMSIQS